MSARISLGAALAKASSWSVDACRSLPPPVMACGMADAALAMAVAASLHLADVEAPAAAPPVDALLLVVVVASVDDDFLSPPPPRLATTKTAASTTTVIRRIWVSSAVRFDTTAWHVGRPRPVRCRTGP